MVAEGRCALGPNACPHSPLSSPWQRLPRSAPPNRDVAVEASEVMKHLNLRPRERTPCQIDDFVALAGVDLQADGSAGREDAWSVGEELTDEIESIRPAVERQSRFGGKRWVFGELLRTQIGEIGEDEIDRTAQP